MRFWGNFMVRFVDSINGKSRVWTQIPRNINLILYALEGTSNSLDIVGDGDMRDDLEKLAKKLNYLFVDTDAMIEDKTNTTIYTLFKDMMII